MLSRLHHWSRSVTARLPALLPSSCALCGISNRDTICPSCRIRYTEQHRHRCRQCALPLPSIALTVGAERCGACLDQPPAYDTTIAAVDYAAPLDQLVLALKFHGRLAMAPLFGQLLRDAMLGSAALQLELPSLLAPVPLSDARLARRGFNQALEIARPLSLSLGIRLEPRLLFRTRDTLAQSTLHLEQRQQNMRAAFAVSDAYVESLRGRHVGVVDDVMTTGATLHELAATLKRFGVARVTNFVFARTVVK